MKSKYLALTISVLLLTACDYRNTTVVVDRTGKYSYSVINIDGCEYLKCEVQGGSVIIHKGNCTNHIK